MSTKNKYSDDHTEQVVSGTYTIDADATVDGDLSVTGDADIDGGLTTDTLTATTIASGNTTITGNLTVTGTVTTHNATVSGTLQRSTFDTVYATIPGVDFMPEGDWAQYATLFTWAISSAGSILMPGGSSSRTFRKGIYSIPNGAKITQIYCFFNPADASGFSVSMALIRRQLTSGTSTTIATASATTGAPGFTNVCSATGLSEVIDYNLYSYTLRVTLDDGAGTLAFENAKILAEITPYD